MTSIPETRNPQPATRNPQPEPLTPFFSIILPTYNRAGLLLRAVRSVIAQTDTSWDLIIVDDGSTDATPEVLREFLADARVRVVSNPHQGLARSRAAGIARAAGTFVTFIDSDDEYAPTHLAERRTYLTEHPGTEFLHGGVTIIGDPYVADKFHPERKIHISKCAVGGTFVIKRSLFERIAWPIVDYGDDNAFYQLAEQAGVSMATAEAPTYIYYRGEQDSLCAIVEAGGIDAAVRFQRG